jgi:hypothetical protein
MKHEPKGGAGLILAAAAAGAAVWAWMRNRPQPAPLGPPSPDWRELALAEQAARDRQAQAGARDRQLETEATHVSFDVAVIGDNIVVPGAGRYRIGIQQLELYNTVAQTIRLLDGQTDLQGPLVLFPAQAGLNLRWQDEPHFKLSYGQPFTLNLTAGRVTGFVKIRMLD